MLESEQRIRETGNAFDDFAVQVLKLPTKYTAAFSGDRPKGAAVGNWLDRDPDMKAPVAADDRERFEMFRKAYMMQSQLRKEAEQKLNRMILNRMDTQDRILGGNSKVMELGEAE